MIYVGVGKRKYDVGRDDDGLDVRGEVNGRLHLCL